MASEVKEGQLFRDEDGDLHVRMESGSLLLRDGGYEVTVYYEEDLLNTDLYPFFCNCKVVEGSVEIVVNLP
jgi:hypothetical protein